MVHIKRVELTNFKSFGGTTGVPLLTGFTVISGPNGSGKSNILDALLFALGLSSSKGMRADRLPDLVNNSQKNRRATVEARVTVTLDLSDLQDQSTLVQRNGKLTTADAELEELEGIDPATDIETVRQALESEWSVTRKLRVTKQGTYTSTYYINGEPCTQTELHEQLQHLRIYPEGYNVVLQGDVTGIITMKPRERREIIDELAGVAQFDRKIILAKEKLETVREREERSRIVEQELVAQRDRLDKDRLKAEKYQKLKQELQQKTQWEAVLNYQTLQQQTQRLQQQIELGDRSLNDLNQQQQQNSQTIQKTATELDQLNVRVKAMGEEELIQLQSTLATQDAQNRQYQQRQQDLQFSIDQTQQQLEETTQELQQYQINLTQLTTELTQADGRLKTCQTQRDQILATVNQTRDAVSSVAEQAEAWMQEQTDLHRNIETWQKTLDPQRTEQARLREKVAQLQKQTEEQQQSLTQLQTEFEQKQQLLTQQQQQQEIAQNQVQSLAQIVSAAEAELQLQQETQTRLLNEQRDRQRQLDKLEAQQQAQQEAAGTYATKMVMQLGLPGVCGLVCQLGWVEPEYQLALEIAAGGRLGHLVVEDDGVAAAGIELLKRKQAGRATFLPLNKIRPGRSQRNQALMRSTEGLVDYAVNLVDCEPRYQDIFAYIFGNTMVFNNLANARRYIGQHRMVTLEGELLEASGAMTGGSQSRRSTFHFGTEETTAEADKAKALMQRLEEIDRILDRCNQAIIQGGQTVKERSQELIEARQTLRDIQQGVNQLEAEIKRLKTQLEQGRSQWQNNTEALKNSQQQLQTLDHEIPLQESQLQHAREMLAKLEEAHRHSEWQQMQYQLRGQETELQQKEEGVRQVQQQILEFKNRQQRLEEKQEEGNQDVQENNKQKTLLTHQLEQVKAQIKTIQTQISATQTQLKVVEESLGEEKQKRDQVETQLRELQLSQQQIEWQIQKLQETQFGRREQFQIKQEQLQAQQGELPDPLPEMPPELDLATLQRELRSLQKRMEALEPVNMLALEEYERTQARLDELSQKLGTLEGERTELLLRIENFTTLRQRAFQEAFDAVNENFQTIFAELSDGDGYLEIDNPEDPFSSALNLIAHPKGKPVQRLASMSGGEKSLTALSFIFALQRYRPSPFYAFDEVDMFLDGANVERLAKMIKRQAEQAQFIVVSLRRPMMEASERTIGVTQARGAHTQVLGLQL